MVQRSPDKPGQFGLNFDERRMTSSGFAGGAALHPVRGDYLDALSAFQREHGNPDPFTAARDNEILWLDASFAGGVSQALADYRRHNCDRVLLSDPPFPAESLAVQIAEAEATIADTARLQLESDVPESARI